MRQVLLYRDRGLVAETTEHKAPSDENSTTPTDAETKDNFELSSLSQRRAHLNDVDIYRM